VEPKDISPCPQQPTMGFLSWAIWIKSIAALCLYGKFNLIHLSMPYFLNSPFPPGFPTKPLFLSILVQLLLISCTIMETPDIPRSKSHIHFLLNWFLQSIHQRLCPCITFHNVLVLYTKQCLSLAQCLEGRLPMLMQYLTATSTSRCHVLPLLEDVHWMMPRYPLNREENSTTFFFSYLLAGQWFHISLGMSLVLILQIPCSFMKILTTPTKDNQ
jgi:hypothetical protein